MHFLIDTHILLWCLEGNSILPDRIIKIIDDFENTPVVSIVSLWEISIKMSLGKLELNHTLEQIYEYIATNGFGILSIDLKHLNTLLNLPYHHKDPFDRLFIAQAISENLSVISADQQFKSYPINSIWEA